MKPRKVIRRVSKSRASDMARYRKDVVPFLLLRSHCFLCGRFVDPTERTNHHKFGKVGRLLNWKPGWNMVHLDCHIWITNHTKEARELGLIGPEGTWNDYERAVKYYEQTQPRPQNTTS